MITYLIVPYEQRHLAKKAGALWNPGRKQWYVKDIPDLSVVSRWLDSHLTGPHKETPYEKEFKERTKPLSKKEAKRAHIKRAKAMQTRTYG